MRRLAAIVVVALIVAGAARVEAQQGAAGTKREKLEAARTAAAAGGDHRQAGWIGHELGWLAFARSDLPEASQAWQRALTEMELAGDVRGRLTIELARTFIASGAEKDALIRSGLAGARLLGDPWLEGGFLHKLGEQQVFDGGYANAVATLEQAIACFERTDRTDTLAHALATLARVYRMHGRPERALELQRRGLQLMEQRGDSDGIVEGLSAVAATERHLGHVAAAIDLQRRAVVRARRSESSRTFGLQRVQLAWLYNDLHQYRQAARLVAAVIHDGDAFAVRLADHPLAVAYLGLGDARRARDSAGRAIANTVEPAAIPDMLATRARAEYRLGHRDEALADIRDALRRIEAVRQHVVPTDSMKQGFAELHQDLFAFAIQLLHDRGDDREALAAAEQARARAFLDLLVSRDRSPDAHHVAGDLESVDSAAPFSADDLVATARELHSTILSYWVMSDATLVWTVAGDGSIHAALSRISAAHLRQLVAQASPSTMPAPVRGAAVVRVAGGSQPGLMSGLTPRAVWRELYAALIAPLGRYLPRQPASLITIEPHGPLFRLSFAGLLDDRGHYLLERYTLHYLPAGGVLAYARRRGTGDAAPQYLLVASPRVLPTAGGLKLAPLPGATRELDGIARVLPREAVRRLTGIDATEAHVRSGAQDRTVLHFATHAVLRDDRPLDSFLALDATTPLGSDDGRLTVQEIYDWRISADLVVLSACRTAGGPITGDGVLGMTRAFFYAGASSVLATLWDVADGPAADLMRRFYAGWRPPTLKATALRNAQLHVLRSLRAGRLTVTAEGGRRVALPEDPMLWAGFALVGAP